jgi:hypothetical protein
MIAKLPRLQQLGWYHCVDPTGLTFEENAFTLSIAEKLAAASRSLEYIVLGFSCFRVHRVAGEFSTLELLKIFDIDSVDIYQLQRF